MTQACTKCGIRTLVWKPYQEEKGQCKYVNPPPPEPLTLALRVDRFYLPVKQNDFTIVAGSVEITGMLQDLLQAATNWLYSVLPAYMDEFCLQNEIQAVCIEIQRLWSVSQSG